MRMRRVFETVAFMAAVGFASVAPFAQAPPQAAGQPPGQRMAGAPQGPRVVSPEILPDKKVTFRLLAPKAAAVVLNGNWENGTNIPMTKDDQGIWSVTVGPLGEQLWGYSFNVDGVKVMRPGQRRVPARRPALRQPAHDHRAGVRRVDVQAGHPARHGVGRLVPVGDPEADGPPDVRLHAARLRSEHREVPGALPAARRRRGRGRVDQRWAAPTSSWTT